MQKTIYERAWELHKVLGGKLDTVPKKRVWTRDDLSLLYTPGVAEPCRLIEKDDDLAWELTIKRNTVAVVTDGSAVLGLGNIGPKAALPVMEGKAVLFKQFGDINAFPICLDTQDPKEIINAVKLIAPTFGGINLEDISAPRCVEIERALIDMDLGIPIFHDDQHGAAIIVCAGLINATKVVKKNISDLTVIVNGIGAAGSAVCRMLSKLGVGRIYAFDKYGVICNDLCHMYNSVWKEISEFTNPLNEDLTLDEALRLADVFIGTSTKDVLTADMVKKMKRNSIVFALANPDPEIPYDVAKEAGVRVVATGRSDYPNQLNNLSVFPGIFKGALRCRASKITDEIKLAVVYAIAGMIPDECLHEECIVPDPMTMPVAEVVADAVERAVHEEN